MGSWQKRARLGAALVGAACAVAVYAGFKARVPAPPPAAIERIDPAAVVESTAGRLQQVRGPDQDYEITFEQQLAYANRRARLLGVRISVKKREGRDFIVTAREAEAGENQVELQLNGDVKLAASDGFELSTEHAVFNQDTGVVRAPGAVTFHKGRMSGNGTGMTYDKNSDVLGITQQAHVMMTGEQGAATMEFQAMSATLDRIQNRLTLDGAVHVLRDQQLLDADRAVALMSEMEEFVTFIELRGNSRVEGGAGTLEAMSARDIDLDYSEDGQLLESVVLTGSAAVTMTGNDGARGREFTGGSLAVQLAADGAATQVSGQENVRVGLPAAGMAPARSITAQTLESRGAAGEGLTSLQFTGRVEYSEEGEGGARQRVARSNALHMGLAQDTVTRALFSGRATFEEQGLEAGGAEAEYHPDAGTLRLSGRDAGGGPHVSDTEVSIEAPFISVALDSREMTARDGVKTTLRPAVPAKGSRGRPSGDAAEGARLPGLFRQDQSANVTSDALVYHGAKNVATFSGSAALWQGETAVRADTIAIDQTKGDLNALGSARATLALEGGTSVGRARDIMYDDARRVITFESPAAAPAAPAGATPAGAVPADAGAGRGVVPGTAAPAGRAAGAAPAAGTVPPPAEPVAAGRGGRAGAPGAARGRGAFVPPPIMSQLSGGEQGDLQAQRIELFLARDAAQLQRVDAQTNVSATIGSRIATGSRLIYRADDEQYDVTGSAAAPVRVVETCREITGKTLTFFKSTDRMIVDGNKEIQTRTGSGPCPSAAPR